ncbi:hypothetical protein AB205_0058660 [Aquarana catesbeiana]|uniref:Uncharacterized protein n=1 Tax=Aquarana catesbeiana TaxID=8400 RepID=A0A2G9S0Y8_AQUCT|nr:hypothetical protein AB205_0058660 [Aquarana catesbeiana]
MQVFKCCVGRMKPDVRLSRGSIEHVDGSVQCPVSFLL